MNESDTRIERAALVLPWPSKDLSPNARVHWSKKSGASAKARNDARLATIAAGWHKHILPEGRLHLWVRFYPPTKRLPDDDNMLARFKPWRDGIADALKIDDKRFVSHPFISDKPVKGGEVRVRITGGSEV